MVILDLPFLLGLMRLFQIDPRISQTIDNKGAKMKTGFRLLVLLGLTLLISTLVVSAVPAQPPEPPEVLENGEFPQDLNRLPQALDERSQATVIAGDNNINTAVSWWSTSGTVFTPSTSTITYNYGGEGCVDTGANSDIWRGGVYLPNGSVITGMYFNYGNQVADPVDSAIYLRRYRYDGVYDDILSVAGSYTGIGNHTHWTGTVANNTVNNYDYAYVLVWSGRVDQTLCGVNLRYTPPPIYLQALPLINR